jgi:hypothetical protein
LLAALLTASCATEENYKQILGSWLGSSERELMDAWGPPDSFYEADGVKYLTYSRGRTVVLPGTPPSYRSTAIGSTLYTTPVGGTPPTALNMHCKTTFTIENGRIQGWRFEGNDCNA